MVDFTELGASILSAVVANGLSGLMADNDEEEVADQMISRYRFDPQGNPTVHCVRDDCVISVLSQFEQHLKKGALIGINEKNARMRIRPPSG